MAHLVCYKLQLFDIARLDIYNQFMFTGASGLPTSYAAPVHKDRKAITCCYKIYKQLFPGAIAREITVFMDGHYLIVSL